MKLLKEIEPIRDKSEAIPLQENSYEVLEFFNEIHHMYKTGTQVTIIECDAVIQRIYDYNGKLENIIVKGRGGTDFEPVFEYLFENRNKFVFQIILHQFYYQLQFSGYLQILSQSHKQIVPDKSNNVSFL